MKSHHRSENEMLFIGIVGRPHSLKGAFFISSRLEPLPKKYKTIFIGDDPGSAKPAEVLSSRMQGDRPLIHCSLAQTREDAEKLTGKKLYVSKQVAHEVFSQDVLWSDLEQCRVVSIAGKHVGRVTDLYDNGATGVVQITGDDGDTADLPLVLDMFDLENVGRIRQEKILTCLLPEEALTSYWSRELAKDDEKDQAKDDEP